VLGQLGRGGRNLIEQIRYVWVVFSYLWVNLGMEGRAGRSMAVSGSNGSSRKLGKNWKFLMAVSWMGFKD
jgi:hypothetical protein